MKLRWLKNILISHDEDTFAVSSMLAILPEDEHEARLLEAFTAWRHSQDLSKKELS